ncbi:MAG: hypothetical protein RLP44_08565 [Aggregatilineales bacterium]
MSEESIRSKIRQSIKPFPRVATSQTSWAGPQTFEQIYDKSNYIG